MFLVNILVVTGVGTLAGMAALATLLQIQPNLRQVLSASASSLGVAALGPMAGFSLAVPLIWEDTVYLLLSMTHPLPRLFGLAVSYILLLAVAFARPLFAVTIVSPLLSTGDSGWFPDTVLLTYSCNKLLTQRVVPGISGWRIAAVAASAPFLFDTILNSRLDVDFDAEKKEKKGFLISPWMLRNFMRVGRISTLVTFYLSMYPGCVAWNSLAGYTFARVASNYCEDQHTLPPLLPY